MTQTPEKRQSLEINPKITQMLELAESNYKVALITMFKGIKKLNRGIEITKKKGNSRMQIKYLK